MLVPLKMSGVNTEKKLLIFVQPIFLHACRLQNAISYRLLTPVYLSWKKHNLKNMAKAFGIIY